MAKCVWHLVGTGGVCVCMCVCVYVCVVYDAGVIFRRR